MLQQQLLRLLHRFNGFFSRTTWVSWYKKGKTSLDLNEARDDGGWWGQLHQLDHVQTIYTSLQTDKHTNKPHGHHTDTSHQSIFTGQMLLLTPNQQCQSTEGTKCNSYSKVKNHHYDHIQLRCLWAIRLTLWTLWIAGTARNNSTQSCSHGHSGLVWVEFNAPLDTI